MTYVWYEHDTKVMRYCDTIGKRTVPKLIRDTVLSIIPREVIVGKKYWALTAKGRTYCILIK